MVDYKTVLLGDFKARMDERPDGSCLVHCTKALEPYARCLTDRLDHWARVTPDATYLAQRDETGAWRRLSYAQVREQVRKLAASLLTRDLSQDRPIAILSGNEIEQALLLLAGMYIGVPVAPISPAYSLIATDFGKLQDIIARLTPGLIYVSHAPAFTKAIVNACPSDIEIVAKTGSLTDRAVTPLSALLEAHATQAVDDANARVNHDTIAKILFTSGSTGVPKGVINTQRMICANQVMIADWLAFGTKEPPVLVDWLPWHHTFGGNHNFGFTLNNGGSRYIDAGKPTPSGIEETIKNLREISPTVYFNVPKGFEELALRLKSDDVLRERFFARLQLMIYAGAALPPHVTRALELAGEDTTGKAVRMITSLGSTETAPASLSCTIETCQPGVVGLPLPGVTLKLLPASGKTELRIKGPNIMPGYWRDPHQSAKAFDDEGFYMIGDAVKFATPGDPNGGFIFDGRISEDFKLVTGTWVSVGPLRARLITAFAPFVKDAVIAGHDRDDITAMFFPDIDACRSFLGDGSLSDEEALGASKLRAEIDARLKAMAQKSTGSSTRVARVLLLSEPPSIDANEITDKGSINQRAVLTRRAALVESLYADKPPEAVICA